MSKESEGEVKVNSKNFPKNLLPAIIALIIAATGWFESHSAISTNEESFEVYKIRIENELEQVKINEAELKGELKSQRDLVTDLRMDIREIRTILESMSKSKEYRR